MLLAASWSSYSSEFGLGSFVAVTLGAGADDGTVGAGVPAGAALGATFLIWLIIFSRTAA
jgi:hypothetical protein